jgi:probable HAF family extracellular repeat protein
MQDLGTLGGANSSGLGINASGQVTGNSEIKGNATFHAFLYSNGSMQDIEPAGSGAFSSGYGINASGQITGFSNYFAFVYSNGSMNVLYNVGAYSSGNGINASGEIVGVREVCCSEMPTVAFTYSNGIEQDVPTLGGIYAGGAGINASGWITGSSDISFSPPLQSNTHAFLYSGSLLVDLGTLGGSNSYGEGINAGNQVTGSSDIPGDASTHAFLYSNGKMLDLNTLDTTSPLAKYVTLTGAPGINDKGWIVANGVDSRTGKEHAYVLKPVTGTGECDDREPCGDDDHSEHHCEDHAKCGDDHSEHHCDENSHCEEGTPHPS